MNVTARSMLYNIASDDDDSEEQTVTDNIIKQLPAVPKFSRYSSHKLENKVIKKGLFNASLEGEDYLIETKHTEITTRQINSPTIFFRDFVNKQENPTTDSQNPTQEIEISVPAPSIPQKIDDKAKRLVFECPSSDDDGQDQSQVKQQQKFHCKILEQKYLYQPVLQKPPQGQTQYSQQKRIYDAYMNKFAFDSNQNIRSSKTPTTPRQISQRSIKKLFMTSQIRKQSILQCKLIKTNSISNLLYSQFDMYFRYFNPQWGHLASCKKFIANIKSNYRISIEADNYSYLNGNVLNKIKQNEPAIYDIYDDGINPNNYQIGMKEQKRQILATVRIILGNGPRSLEVYLLKSGANYHELSKPWEEIQFNLMTLYQIKGNQDKIKLYRSRKPSWDQINKGYYIELQGRAMLTSIRNFILEDPVTKEEILMFGKQQNNIYNIDISHPLTPSLGFAIVIPQLDLEG